MLENTKTKTRRAKRKNRHGDQISPSQNITYWLDPSDHAGKTKYGNNISNSDWLRYEAARINKNSKHKCVIRRWKNKLSLAYVDGYYENCTWIPAVNAF